MDICGGVTIDPPLETIAAAVATGIEASHPAILDRFLYVVQVHSEGDRLVAQPQIITCTFPWVREDSPPIPGSASSAGWVDALVTRALTMLSSARLRFLTKVADWNGMSGLRVGVPSQVAPLLGLTYETGRWQLLAALQPAWSPPIPYAGGQLSMTDLQLSLGAGLTLTQAESWSLGPALQLTGGASGWWWKGGAPSATAWSPLLTLQPGVGLGLGERVGVKAGLDIALVRGGVIEKGEEVIGQSTLHATVGAETYFW